VHGHGEGLQTSPAAVSQPRRMGSTVPCSIPAGAKWHGNPETSTDTGRQRGVNGDYGARYKKPRLLSATGREIVGPSYAAGSLRIQEPTHDEGRKRSAGQRDEDITGWKRTAGLADEQRVKLCNLLQEFSGCFARDYTRRYLG
jgi:hypothetical protein